jgi:C_GCAxxG_C_C family probable redox protein
MAELSDENQFHTFPRTLRIDEAAAHFAEGYSCSQAVFVTFAPQLGLDERTALKIASPFGGGMGRTGGPCGAVSGALMALGLAAGHTDPLDKAGKEKMYAISREFIERFQGLHGAINCPALLGTDIGTSEGMQTARETGVLKTKCPVFVRDAVGILEDFFRKNLSAENYDVQDSQS